MTASVDIPSDHRPTLWLVIEHLPQPRGGPEALQASLRRLHSPSVRGVAKHTQQHLGGSHQAVPDTAIFLLAPLSVYGGVHGRPHQPAPSLIHALRAGTNSALMPCAGTPLEVSKRRATAPLFYCALGLFSLELVFTGACGPSLS